MRSDNPLCREESSRMLFYAAQGVSCAARVRKPLISGTSSKPKVLNPTARTASQESHVFDTKNCWVGCLAQQPEALLHQLPGSMFQRKSNLPPLHAGLVQKTRVSKQKVQVSGNQAAVQHSKSGSAQANYTTGAYRVSLEVGSALQKVQATATCSMSFKRNLSLFFSALK